MIGGAGMAELIKKAHKCVLQDWVMELPLREQGTLLTVIRGCDLVPKYPINSDERVLVAFLRFMILNPADSREVESGGSFMSRTIPVVRPQAYGHYPLHYVMHLVHAIEIVGYRHPDTEVSDRFNDYYRAFCKSFHLQPESACQMIERLSEDRIANGTTE